MGNAKRYSQFFSSIYENNQKSKLICTSNITETKENVDYVVNYAELVCKDSDVIYDNPLVLLLNLLPKLNVKNAVLAGFDGYDNVIENNYYKEYVPMLYDTKNVINRNDSLKAFINSAKAKINILTITPSKYL